MDNVMKLALILSISDRMTAPMGKVTKVLQNVKLDAYKAGQALQKMGLQMKQSGINKMQTAKSSIVDAIGMGAMLASPIKSAIEFESVMADVNKVANFSKPEYAAMSKEILNLSKRLPMAASGLGEIMAAAAQSGIAKNELLRFTEDAAKMGIAFDISAAEAGSAMTGLRNIFHLTQNGVISLGDAVNHLSNNMDASAPNILNFLNRAGSVGDTFKMSGQQVSAFGAAMIAMKTPPEIASRAFGAMLMQLSVGKKATKDQKAAFAQLGMSAEQMANMIKKDASGALVTFLEAVKKSSDPMGVLRSLVGQGFADDTVKLVGGLDKLKSALGLVGDKSKYAGSMGQEYQTRAGTTANALQLLKNNVNAAAITVGSIFLPALNDVLKPITSVVESLSQWAEKHPALIEWVGKLTAAVVALSVAGAGMKFVGGFFMSNLFSPVLSGGGKFLSFLGDANAGIKMYKEAGSGVVASALKGTWAATGLSLKLDKPVSWLKKSFSGLTQRAGGLKLPATTVALEGASTYSNAGGLWTGLGKGLKKTWGSAKDFSGAALSQANSGLKSLKAGLLEGAAAAKKFIVSFALSAWAGLKTFGTWLLSTAIPAVWSFTTALLANPMTWVVVGVVALGAAIYALWKNWDKVTKTVSRWWSSVKSFLSPLVEWFKALPGRIWDALTSLYDSITAPFRTAIDKVTEWWEGFKSWFTGSPVKSTVDVTTNVSAPRVHGMLTGAPAAASPTPGLSLSKQSIARHAAGGLVSKPTVSWIGEAGAEMVLPLTNRSRGRSLWLWAGRLLGMQPEAQMLSKPTPSLWRSKLLGMQPEAQMLSKPTPSLWRSKLLGMQPEAQTDVSSTLATTDALKAPSLDLHTPNPRREPRQGATRRKEKERRPFIIGGPLTINVDGASDPRKFVETMTAELRKLVDSRGAAEAKAW